MNRSRNSKMHIKYRKVKMGRDKARLSRELYNKSRKTRRRYSREYNRSNILRNSRHSRKTLRDNIVANYVAHEEPKDILQDIVNCSQVENIENISDSSIIFNELGEYGYNYIMSTYDRHEKLQIILGTMNINELIKKMDRLRKLIKHNNIKCASIIHCDLKWLMTLPEYTISKQQDGIPKAQLKSDAEKKKSKYFKLHK